MSDTPQSPSTIRPTKFVTVSIEVYVHEDKNTWYDRNKNGSADSRITLPISLPFPSHFPLDLDLLGDALLQSAHADFVFKSLPESEEDPI